MDPRIQTLSDHIHGVNLSRQIQVEDDFDGMSKKIEGILNTDFDIFKERLKHEQLKYSNVNQSQIALEESDVSDMSDGSEDVEKLLRNVQKYEKMQIKLEQEIKDAENSKETT